MAHGHDSHHEIIKPRNLELSRNFKVTCAVMIAIGVAAFGIGLAINPHSAWNGYLIGFWFTMSLGLSGPFICSTQHLAIAGWSPAVRRIPESFGAFILPAAGLALFGAIVGGHDLYHWLHEGVVEGDPILSKKAGFLTMNGFLISIVVSFVAWTATAGWMRKSSVDQDESGDYALTERMKWASCAFLVTFVIGFSFLSWYFIMSLEPHWFSTMFNVYCFAGLFQSGLALTVLLVIWLMKRGYFGSFVGTKHIHDLGKLLFGFTTFYAYIAFCQFLLIWYANIPEEDLWFVQRFSDGWGMFMLILPFFKFIIPFLIMLPQDIKKNKDNWLVYVASALFCAQIYEVWLWVAPTPHGGKPSPPHAPILEVLIVLGFVGLFALVVGYALSKRNIVPLKDPFLHESMPGGHH